MTLGGLAIAVGLLVDAAIIMVENILHRLAGASTRAERRERALSAAIEVARPIAFATLIVIVVFLPLFGMTGIEGRMYQPLAAAVIAAMAAALVLAVTLVPIVAAAGPAPARARGGRRCLRCCGWSSGGIAPMLDRCLRAPAARRCWSPCCSPCQSLALGARRRQRLHAAARRRRVPAADGAAAEAVPRRSRSPEPSGRGRAARRCRRSRTSSAEPVGPSGPKIRCRTRCRTCWSC